MNTLKKWRVVIACTIIILLAIAFSSFLLLETVHQQAELKQAQDRETTNLMLKEFSGDSAPGSRL